MNTPFTTAHQGHEVDQSEDAARLKNRIDELMQEVKERRINRESFKKQESHP